MPPVTRLPAGQLMDAIQNGRYPFWYPDSAKGLAIEYFVFGTDFTPLNAGATATQSISITGDAAFIVLSAVLVLTDTTNLVFLSNRPLLADIGEGGSGRHLSNTPIHVNNWFGTAEEPKYWDVPRLLAPNTNMNVQMQNLDAANARNVRVAFHGFKIYGFTPK